MRRYIRLRTLFEAIRDGGLSHLQWTMTDRQPDANPKVRVVLPTSQIFLPEAATLGTSGVDPFRQPEIYPDTHSANSSGGLRCPGEPRLCLVRRRAGRSPEVPR